MGKRLRPNHAATRTGLLVRLRGCQTPKETTPGGTLRRIHRQYLTKRQRDGSFGATETVFTAGRTLYIRKSPAHWTDRCNHASTPRRPTSLGLPRRTSSDPPPFPRRTSICFRATGRTGCLYAIAMTLFLSGGPSTLTMNEIPSYDVADRRRFLVLVDCLVTTMSSWIVSSIISARSAESSTRE